MIERCSLQGWGAGLEAWLTDPRKAPHSPSSIGPISSRSNLQNVMICRIRNDPLFLRTYTLPFVGSVLYPTLDSWSFFLIICAIRTINKGIQQVVTCHIVWEYCSIRVIRPQNLILLPKAEVKIIPCRNDNLLIIYRSLTTTFPMLLSYFDSNFWTILPIWHTIPCIFFF